MYMNKKKQHDLLVKQKILTFTGKTFSEYLGRYFQECLTHTLFLDLRNEGFWSPIIQTPSFILEARLDRAFESQWYSAKHPTTMSSLFQLQNFGKKVLTNKCCSDGTDVTNSKGHRHRWGEIDFDNHWLLVARISDVNDAPLKIDISESMSLAVAILHVEYIDSVWRGTISTNLVVNCIFALCHTT